MSTDPLNGYRVGEGYDLLISGHGRIEDWSICQLCLDIVKNSSKNMPDSYWCCPECASEAVELPYYSLKDYLAKNDVQAISLQLKEWQKRSDLVSSYKLLRELRLMKLIELCNVT